MKSYPRNVRAIEFESGTPSEVLDELMLLPAEPFIYRHELRRAEGAVVGNALVEHADGQLTAAALFAYSRGEQAAPNNPAPTYFLGLAFLRAGEPGRTLALWRELLEAAPENAEWRAPLAARLDRLETMLGVAEPSAAQQSEE